MPECSWCWDGQPASFVLTNAYIDGAKPEIMPWDKEYCCERHLQWLLGHQMVMTIEHVTEEEGVSA